MSPARREANTVFTSCVLSGHKFEKTPRLQPLYRTSSSPKSHIVKRVQTASDAMSTVFKAYHILPSSNTKLSVQFSTA